MQLSDFFANFNSYNIVVFLIAFFIFDAIGSTIARLVQSPLYLRTVYWIWGLSIFVFIWFLLHMFMPFLPQYVWTSLIICGILSFPVYIKSGGPKSLLKEIIKFPYPLLIILIVFKPMYFMLSAPPYWTDEMAYHFYSPARLAVEGRWVFLSGPSLYEMIPKFLDTSYILIFSLTRTYAIARVIHFLVVFTSIFSISVFLRQNINVFAGILFSFFSLLLSAKFLESSTLGYVDAGAAVFSILFLITIIDVFIKKRKKYLYPAAIVFGVTVSMKYTVLTFTGSIILVSIIIALFLYYRNILALFKTNSIKWNISKHVKTFIFVSLLVSFFGGYWYIKNIIISGNPIFPFYFKCFSGYTCGTGNDFFAGWATPMDWLHFPIIKDVIFQSDSFFIFILISVFVGMIYLFNHKIPAIRIISPLILLSVIFEIIISHNISGFELRYYYHWAMLLPLILVIPFIIPTRILLRSRRYFVILLFIVEILTISSAGKVVWKNVKKIYEPNFIPGYVRNYAMNRTSLNQWLDYYFPEMNEVIQWCGQKHPMQKILILDPALIWFSYEGMMRVYLVNCTISNPFSPQYTAEKQAEEITHNYKNKYVVSLEKCDPNSPYINPEPKNELLLIRHELNQRVICQSKEVMKNIYAISSPL